MDALFEDAIRRGDATEVRDMLARGVDVAARDRHGQTGLMLAALLGYRDVVCALVDYGADLNASAKFRLTALMLAIVAAHPEVARVIADAGADLTLRGSGAPGFADKTAYDLAIERGMDDLAPRLKPEV